MDPFDWADLDSVICSVQKIQDTLTHDCTGFHIFSLWKEKPKIKNSTKHLFIYKIDVYFYLACKNCYYVLYYISLNVLSVCMFLDKTILFNPNDISVQLFVIYNYYGA